jgi:hypothetical protein
MFSLGLILSFVLVLFGNAVFWHAITHDYWFGWLVAGALQLLGIVSMIDHTADHFFREGFNKNWEEKRAKKG